MNTADCITILLYLTELSSTVAFVRVTTMCFDQGNNVPYPKSNDDTRVKAQQEVIAVFKKELIEHRKEIRELQARVNELSAEIYRV